MSSFSLTPINKYNDVDHRGFLEWCAVRFLLLSLIISSVGNQHLDSQLGMFIGQISGWFSLIFGLFIILNSYKHQKLFILLFCGLLAARFLRVAIGDIIVLYSLYTILLAAFYCSASAALIFKYPVTTIKVVRWICYLSVPLMLIQIMGIAEWSHSMRTDDHGYGITQYPALFKEFGVIPLTTLQTRPSGIFHANNLLSLFAIFACLIQLVTIREKHIFPSDIPVFLVAVLSMSKFVFIVLLLIFLRQIFFADLPQKLRAFKLFILVIFLTTIYAILFPGFFEYNFSIQNYYLGLMIRFYDIVSALGGIQMTGVMLTNAAGAVSLYSSSGAESGYTLIFLLPKELLIAMAIIFSFIAYKFFQTLKQLPSFERDISLLSLILLFTMPVITGFFTGPLFWFFLGGILLPFIKSSKLNY